MLEGQVQLNDEVSHDRHTWQPVHAVPEVVPPELRGGEGALAAGSKTKAPVPVTAISVFFVLVAAVIGFAVWWGGNTQDVGPNCAALPSPGVDWRNCKLPGLQARGARMPGARLQSGDLSAAQLGGADLSGAQLDFTDLRKADLGYALLRSASLRGANLRGADLTNAELSQADLSYADLTQAVVGGTVLSGARLDGTLWLDGKPCAPGSLGSCRPAAADKGP
jgi:hypothetical protein